jgi:hypothetical protein
MLLRSTTATATFDPYAQSSDSASSIDPATFSGGPFQTPVVAVRAPQTPAERLAAEPGLLPSLVEGIARAEARTLLREALGRATPDAAVEIVRGAQALGHYDDVIPSLAARPALAQRLIAEGFFASLSATDRDTEAYALAAVLRAPHELRACGPTQSASFRVVSLAARGAPSALLHASHDALEDLAFANRLLEEVGDHLFELLPASTRARIAMRDACAVLALLEG